VDARSIDGLLFWFPAFVFSTTVHEAAHAWTALRGGDATAYHGGQVTLSPLPHIRREPIGMLVLPLLSAVTSGWAIGWASAPFDPVWAAKHPRRAGLMAAAGPLANMLLALAAWAAIKAGLAAGAFAVNDYASASTLVVATAPGEFAAFGAKALSVMLSLNTLLAVFNLLPVPPLDGSAVVDLVAPIGYARMLRRLGPAGSLLGLLVAWKVFPFVVGPVLRFVVGTI
jgi:Zn-dependent protease